ncbi:hypothetical protein D3C72_1132670 [compost metagenome]
MPDGKFRLGTSSASKAIALGDPVEDRIAALEQAVSMPHTAPPFGGPTVPPPFFPGGGGASTKSTRGFIDG